MEQRNKHLESDGLYFESETHEWFHDKISTQYAHKKSQLFGSGEQNDSLDNLFCFVVRDKATGEYNRVVLDRNAERIVYDTKSFEELGFFIDKLKLQKRFF